MEDMKQVEMITDYSTQLETMRMANDALAQAAAALKKARNRIVVVRTSFPGRVKDSNKILKGIDASEAKCWDSIVLANEMTQDIKLCKEQEEAEPDLPGMPGLR